MLKLFEHNVMQILRQKAGITTQGVLPSMGYIFICGPKGYIFSGSRFGHQEVILVFVLWS